VAHDFNNMLGVILGYTDLILLKLAPGQPFHTELNQIRKAAEHSAELTRQLLAFARKQTATPREIELNGVVAGMLRMLRRLIGEDIDLVWQPAEKLWPIRMDPSQIEQILANLCVNARDAIDGPGRVTIETSNRLVEAEFCATHAESLPGEYVFLGVGDTGCGMDKSTLDKLFDPFFTTKEVGKGTGLGLAMVYGIVKQNQGFIDVDSQPGRGTTFSIYLPRWRPHGDSAPRDRADAPVLSGNETILIVEDEPMILDMAVTMLEFQGYTVLAATTASEALRLAQETTGDIHLVLTDVVMPELNGRELFESLRALRPHLRCLYMSGYPANIIAPHGMLDEGVHFIQKPFSVNDLGAKVRLALEIKIDPVR
jgi:CheY-like chemotaxis protein